MPKHRSIKLTIVSAVAGAIVLAGMPAMAAPLSAGATQFKSAATSDIEQVRWRGHRGGGGAVIGGIAAGMLLGGIIASSPYYYGGRGYYYGPPAYYPPPYYGPAYGPDGWDAYCFSRYRSYDPYSGTYMGYDGFRHPCR